jgi:predicted nucleic acid-binding protein
MPVERIENLPAGTRLFLDANIFVYAFLGHSNECQGLLGRCATEQVLGITTLDVVNEVTHRMRCIVALRMGKDVGNFRRLRLRLDTWS